MENQKFTPETMTRIVFGNYREVFFEENDADSWITRIGKRIGNSLHFKIYEVMDRKYEFLVGLFDEKDNVLVAENRHKPGTVAPAYCWFYYNSGTFWDIEINDAKMTCLEYIKRKFYIDYTLQLSTRDYILLDGIEFPPIPDSNSIGGLVFNMAMTKYGKQ